MTDSGRASPERGMGKAEGMRSPSRLITRIAAVLCLAAVVGACSKDSKPSANSAPVSSSSSSTSPSSASSAPPPSSAAPTTGGAWLTWGGTPDRSGVTADGPDRNGLHLAWTSAGLDGDVYGEPLVVGDTVIVATTGNSVYAFDAATGTTKWQALKLGEPVAGSAAPCGNVDPIGIESTPVADPANNRVYVVGLMQPAHDELIALDLRTGAVLFQKTVDAPGADPLVHNQRGALAFANNRVYVPYGGRFGDCGNYKGRVVSVAADGSGDLQTYAIRADSQGGFWAPGGPPVAPDGSLFVTSGNSDSRQDFDDGNAVIHLNADLQPTDEFAPSNWAQLNSSDTDLGTTMPALLDNNRIFQVGKSGVGYVMDATKLGGVGGELHQDRVCDRVFGGLAHDASTVFVPCSSQVRSLTISDTAFTEQWTVNLAKPGPPIVANGLVWVLEVGSGTLHALDRDTGGEVFSANVGAVTHFSAPSAGNHTVFVEGGKTVQAYTSSSSDSPNP
jgi:outer membrane protein assembly factor BamB